MIDRNRSDRFALLQFDESGPAASPPVEQCISLPKSTSIVEQPPLHRHVEPYADHVDGEQVLDDVFATIKRYVVAEDHTLRAATLWAIHTWLMDVWTVSPIANITAPDMRCGKTLLLQVLEELVCRPLSTSNITPAAMFRMAHEFHPTLLIDEVDSFLKGNDDARGMLNSGLYKKNAFVVRCVSDDTAPRQFSVWCPKALCGIGSLAATLADRSIALRLRRKLPSESTENLRRSDPRQWSALRSRILRWTTDKRDALRAYVPQAIAGINDRANDCWEPLAAIAEISGARWAEYAKSAALALDEGDDNASSAHIELLRDVAVYVSPRNPKVYSSSLLDWLNGNKARRWMRFNNGNPLRARQLASMLRRFGIEAKPIRIGDRAGRNGYEFSSCEDAFARYFPPDPDATPTVRLAA